jgi:hypothetical protein
MPAPDPLKIYLAGLCAHLPPGLGWGARSRILAEIEDHILAAVEEARAEGQSETLALEQALARCGSPAIIAGAFHEVADLRWVHRTRARSLAALVLCVGLVGLTLLRYPAISGSGAMTVPYLLLCAAILGGYARVGLPTAQEATPEGLVPWRRGTRMGLLAGLVGAVAGLAATLALADLWSSANSANVGTVLWADHRVEEAELALPFFFWCGGTFASSVLAAARTGQRRTGLQLGLWSSIVYVLCSLVTGLVRTHLFANTLAQTVWAHDVVCQTTRDLATCAIGDDLGGLTNALLIFPILGIGVGWLGGKLGSQEHRARPVSDQAGGTAPRPPRSIPLFVLWSCALFLMGIIGHFW